MKESQDDRLFDAAKELIIFIEKKYEIKTLDEYKCQHLRKLSEEVRNGIIKRGV